jgi:branched-chain amino acid transport system ATP-binding protein
MEGVTAGYGGPPVITEVSLGVARGAIAAVVGPNGAGKSTLLKAAIGELTVTAGVVTLDGNPVTNLPIDELARKGLGYVPQSRDVFDPLTVRENLEMGGYLLSRTQMADRMAEVLDVFVILKRLLGRRAGLLSGGERKVAAIARVLMLGPSVLILDEPTAGLSPKLSSELLTQHVRGLADRGVAVLLVEQKVVDALAISDWAYVLANGKVRLSKPAAELAGRQDLTDVYLGTGEPDLDDAVEANTRV